MIATSQIDRRDFLGAIGGGIVVLFGLDASAPSAAAWPAYPSDFHAYLAIGADGRVTVFSGKIEMGQGVMTSLAQMAAEELGADLASIDMVMGDTDKCPWDMGTFGSLSTRMFGPALRAAAAKARAVLTTLAAAKLGVAADRVTIEHGVVSVAGEPTRRVSFAELADGAGIAEQVNQAAALRSVADFAVIGKSPKRLACYFPSSSQPNFSRALRATSALGVLVGGNLSRQDHGRQASMIATECVMSPRARFSGVSRGSAGESHEPSMNWIDSFGSVRVSIAHNS